MREELYGLVKVPYRKNSAIAMALSQFFVCNRFEISQPCHGGNYAARE